MGIKKTGGQNLRVAKKKPREDLTFLGYRLKANSVGGQQTNLTRGISMLRAIRRVTEKG